MRHAERNHRSIAAALAAGLLLTFAAPRAFAAGDPMYPEDADNPLKVVYYFVAPVGTLVEWTVTRPLAAMGYYIAPHDRIGTRPYTACARERPGRSCTSTMR